MKNLMFGESFELFDEIEARREHERYQCDGIVVSYLPLGSGCSPHIAEAQDISLKGLSIQTTEQLKSGALLSIEIQNADTQNNEALTAEIMWCKANASDQYIAGLKVISADDLREVSANDSDNSSPSKNTQHQLICPSCNETSFFLREISNNIAKPELYHCCRCNHSHPITEVVSYNRHL